jgi:hypothetical protein
MKFVFALFMLLGLGTANASLLGLFTVKQPLYLHGSDADAQVAFFDVPVASAGSTPESAFAAISMPFIPPSDGSWRQPKDVNLASLYGIRVSAVEDSSKTLRHWIITVDASASKIPEGYPFTIEQVTDAVVTCVKSMSPIRPPGEHKITLTVVPPRK